jgi:hypothetical protein
MLTGGTEDKEHVMSQKLDASPAVIGIDTRGMARATANLDGPCARRTSARHERFRESDALQRVFEDVVAMCITAGLVGGEAFSVDASLIKADVDKKKRTPGDQPIAWPRAEQDAVREYLAALDTATAMRRATETMVVRAAVVAASLPKKSR